MVNPTFETSSQELSVPLPDEPLAAIARLAAAAAQDEFVAYESGQEWTFARGCRAEVIGDRHGLRLRGPVRAERSWGDSPLAAVQELLDSVGVPGWRAYGWAAFELADAIAGITTDDDRPLLHLSIPHVLVHLTQGSAHIRSTDTAAAAAAAAAVLDATPTTAAQWTPIRVPEHGAQAYRRQVERAIAAIGEHDLEKVVLSRRITVDDEIDLIDTCLAGRRGNTPARSFLLRLGGVEATGFSPEIVLTVAADGRVVTRTLAGTRALTAGNDAHNERLRLNLLRDPKEIYEHAISVKIAVEDLTRVCRPDTVAVEDFMTVRERGSVQHLCSRVSGKLAPNRNAWDAFEATFPAVTATGAPKLAARRHIRAAEDGPRRLYGGSVLTVGHDGTMDAALVLRGVYREAGATWLQAGAGIVAQSTPDREFEETCEKLGSVARFLIPVARSTAVVDTSSRSSW
ncbi:salicylate synthase [Nocardia sp. CNY236]|uniref:salicylate synthase n=1 Tax=Nocardia sp. CNY236 TaxID=1169152 RepID=UPI00041D4884|nr:salicylate synthase [Nocardia sp. CNY236]